MFSSIHSICRSVVASSCLLLPVYAFAASDQNLADRVTALEAKVQAQAGQKKEAAASLQSFQSTYPHSALAPDVDETLKRLQ